MPVRAEHLTSPLEAPRELPSVHGISLAGEKLPSTCFPLVYSLEAEPHVVHLCVPWVLCPTVSWKGTFLSSALRNVLPGEKVPERHRGTDDILNF